MPAHRLLFLFMSRAICSAPSMMSFAALLPPMWCICRLDTFTDATSDLIVSTFGISTKKICFSLCYGRGRLATHYGASDLDLLYCPDREPGGPERHRRFGLHARPVIKRVW